MGKIKNSILNPFYWYGVAEVCGPGKIKMPNIQNIHFWGNKISEKYTRFTVIGNVSKREGVMFSNNYRHYKIH